MNINDIVLIRCRSAIHYRTHYKQALKAARKSAKYYQRIAELQHERDQLIIDMEQEAEPGGGVICDQYGEALNAIDEKIAKQSNKIRKILKRIL